MMDTRSQCYRCRQWFSVPPNTATIKCPSCKFETKTHSFERSKSQDGGRISFRSFLETARTKLSRCGTGSSKSYESLNCKPSTLLFSESLSGLRPCRKRALLIGVTYKNSKHKLKGTIIDVKGFRGLLMDTFTFPKEDIRVLTEEEPEPDFFPTKKNIQNSFKWLVEDCMAGDSLVFYFSGHGIKQFDLDGDESDGFDETICPVDFMEAGTITDDEIKSAIVRPLKKGVTLNAIVDACHSGTVLDLPYVYNRKEKKWENSTRLSEEEKHTDRGLAISLAACEDIQVAADTSVRDSFTSRYLCLFLLMDTEVELIPATLFFNILDTIYMIIQHFSVEVQIPEIVSVLNPDIYEYAVLHWKVIDKWWCHDQRFDTNCGEETYNNIW
ncbi:metacaspase-1-like isoform X1 [Populus alba x Populus x berolinensis]|uniref:Metacaspase-1-like isoform X1 n=1 Tax=Populus alba x Populus x berolinensis TaxID=444605 RepID=A0AAD6LEV8_9ROSI|nr:metacaspase-1-like isoform X1 [Populus alba x Populus x berolinensis]